MYASVNRTVITLGLFCTKHLPETILSYFRNQIRRNQIEPEHNKEVYLKMSPAKMSAVFQALRVKTLANITCPVKSGVKLLIHSQTSTVVPLKFGNG